MATITDVVTEIQTALQDACSVAGTQSPMDLLTAAQAQVSTLQASLANVTADDAKLTAKLANVQAAADAVENALKA